MKKIVLSSLTFLLFFLFSCDEKENLSNNANLNIKNSKIEKKFFSIDTLIRKFEDSKDKHVIVVAHRGDWRNAPENTLQAIENCIEMGVDMVEIDVRETKDGKLILMHDKTVDRTTTGTGKVSELTWDYLQSLELINGIRRSTPHNIPTLEKALYTSKDKILINLDIKDYNIVEKCFKLIEQTKTQRQVIVKGQITYKDLKNQFGMYLDKAHFMPIVDLSKNNSSEIIQSYLSNFKPVAFEFIIPQDTLKMIKKFGDIRENGTSVWVNSLWPELSGGHDDEKAALDLTTYDWYIENNIDIIQTDRPQLLLNYLRDRGLHD